MDLKKIDLDKLQDYAFTANEIAMSPMTSWNSKFINIKCLDNESLIPTVKAIPLDLIKQAREEIQEKAITDEIFDEDVFNSTNTDSISREAAECESWVETEVVKMSNVLDILDKLIAESEE